MRAVAATAQIYILGQDFRSDYEYICHFKAIAPHLSFVTAEQVDYDAVFQSSSQLLCVGPWHFPASTVELTVTRGRVTGK